MNKKLLEMIVCPKCKSDLECKGGRLLDGKSYDSGNLKCSDCGRSYPIFNGIPRFVDPENYASSFGYQWNKFRREQIDSFNGTTLSADRLWSETGWTKEELRGKWVLDAGCGAGRFLDAASHSEGQFVGVDISNAIDAARDNLKGRDNVHFIQASIYDLPFREGTFDRCYCIGVIQHTPEPDRSLRSLAKIIKPDGKLAVTIYPRKPWTKLYSKYWLRPLTKRLRKEKLLKLIEAAMPVAFPVTDVLFRIPVLGRVFKFTIPVANYVEERQLTREQRYAWAVLDTFDMLSPYYDQPMTESEAAEALRQEGVSAHRSSQSGLNLIGQKG